MKLFTVFSRLCIAACAFGGLPYAVSAQQADYPVRPVRMIVAWSPGGATDILARLVATELGQRLGQQVIVENRPGAGGTIGHAQAASAPADGYTLVLATNSTYAIAEYLYPALPYRHVRDLTPVSELASSPLILAARPTLSLHDAAGLLDLARQRPDALNIASGGNGSTSHLAAELLMTLTDTRMTHVPYRGGGPAALALAAGEVDVAFLDLGVAAPLIADGRIHGLAVSGALRSSLLPEIPTFHESGLPPFNATTRFALFAPAGTPTVVVAKLQAAVRHALDTPALRDRLVRQGTAVIGSSSEALRQSVAAESAQWQRIIEERNIVLQ